MDYAQYQPPSHGQHPHAPHLQGGYQTTTHNPGPPGSSITSPSNQSSQLHQQHPHQGSPILASQNHTYQTQPAASTSHSVHQGLNYSQPYSTVPSNMHQQYGISQAAAMATAAASGQSNYSYLPQTSVAEGLARESPRMAGIGIKNEQPRRSPPQVSNQMPPLPSQVQVHPTHPAHRMPSGALSQHVSSPHAPNAQTAMMNHQPTRNPAPPPMPPPPQQQPPPHPPSPEIVATGG